jgi:CHAT domain-containing protein
MEISYISIMSRLKFIIIFLLIFAADIFSQEQSRTIYNYLLKFGELYSVGEFNNAKRTLQKILESTGPVNEEYLIITYIDLGLVNKILGKYDESLKCFYKAEGLINNNSSYFGYLAEVYINIGTIYGVKRSFSESIDFLEKGIRIYKSTKSPERRVNQNLSTAYLNLGLTYYMIENYKEALEFLEASQTLKLKFNLSEKALLYLSFAKVAAKKGDLSGAEKYYLKSIDEFVKEFGPGYYRLTSVYFDYGILLNSVGREQESYELYQKSLAICLKTYNEKHPFVSLAYRHIGDHFMQITEYDSALIYYQKSLIAGVVNFNNPAVYSNPSLDSVLIDVDLIRSLQKKSEALKMFSLQQVQLDMKIKMMKQSFETSEVILKLISNIRNNFMSEESRTYLAENEKETYFFAAQITQQLYSITNDPSYIKIMYKIATECKSAVLRREIEENKFFYSKNTPDSLKQKLDNLNSSISAFRALILEESQKIVPSGEKLNLWKDTLFSMSNQKSKTLDEILNLSPQSQLTLMKAEPMSLEKIQSLLHKDESIIEYFLSNSWSSGKRKLFIFVITRGQINYKESEIDSLFIQEIGKIDQCLTRYEQQKSQNNDFSTFTTCLNDMYNKLIKPVELFFVGKKLIIIPDEEIEYLSFDAFQKDKPDSSQTDYASLNYLIKYYTFSYGFSSSLIFNKDRDRKSIHDVYAFSPSYNENTGSSNLKTNYLKGTSIETSSIKRWFNCIEYKDESATENNFKSVMENPAIFHLAMHSFQVNDNSKNSYLLFDNKNDTLEDGKLYNYEIELDRMNSPLVVLSACNTGSGTLYPGEGVMSLGRGFILAGTESILKTMWNVNDEVSSKIMTNFYRYLSKGKDKDEALRLSKLEYLKTASSTYANPFYWAGYEIVGDKKAIVKSKKIHLYFISGIILILICSFVLYYFKIRKISRA